MTIDRVHELPADFPAMERESQAEGFRFLQKLRTEWDSGRNQFDADGEALYAMYAGNELAAIGGLNRDPYSTAPGTGRVRHLYVRAQHRRRGFGAALVARIRDDAVFTRLRLRTDTATAARFYENLGFRAVSDASATHELVLKENN